MNFLALAVIAGQWHTGGMSGWKTIGIIVSVLWILGASIYFYKAIADDSRTAAIIGSAIFTFVSLALGWGFVYLVVFLVAWVKRGFRQPRNSNSPISRG